MNGLLVSENSALQHLQEVISSDSGTSKLSYAFAAMPLSCGDQCCRADSPDLRDVDLFASVLLAPRKLSMFNVVRMVHPRYIPDGSFIADQLINDSIFSSSFC